MYYDLDDNENKYKKLFIERVRRHIERVNKYAQRIGKRYFGHDNDKLQSPLVDYYYLDMKRNYETLTEKEKHNLLIAGMKHRITNKHHPEFWDKGNIYNMTSIRSNPKVPFNCQNMPKDALEEMCADWCAMSEEFGNTPFEWYRNIKNVRYIFSDNQEYLIYDILEKMWSGDTGSGANSKMNSLAINE